MIDYLNALMIRRWSTRTPDLDAIFVRAADSLPDGSSRVLAIVYLANVEILLGAGARIPEGVALAESAKTLGARLGLGAEFGTGDSLAGAVCPPSAVPSSATRPPSRNCPSESRRPVSSSVAPTWSTAWAGSSGWMTWSSRRRSSR